MPVGAPIESLGDLNAWIRMNLERNTGFEPATIALGKAMRPCPHGRSVLSSIQAMTAARRAAWSGMPSALARLSRCLQTLAGKRTERGTVGPVSVPFLGLPRPAWMEIPAAATRRAYGLRRILALSKFIDEQRHCPVSA